jgi:hypothetical protein
LNTSRIKWTTRSGTVPPVPTRRSGAATGRKKPTRPMRRSSMVMMPKETSTLPL